MQNKMMCAWCDEDMTDDVCFNAKDICINCCIEAGDLCSHHRCSKTCECGHREEHGFASSELTPTFANSVLVPTLIVLGFIALMAIYGAIETAGYPISSP